MDLATYWSTTQKLGTCVDVKNRLYQRGPTTGVRAPCSPRTEFVRSASFVGIVLHKCCNRYV